MREILLHEWPIFKEALIIAVSIPLSVLFPMMVVNFSLPTTQKPAEEVFIQSL